MFVLFRYRILFLYVFPVARTLTLWGAEMLNTFELNQQSLQTFRCVPSALVPYAQGYERTRIPLNKIKTFLPIAGTLTLWGAEMLNTFELNQQILQTFRSVPSALVLYAQGYERTRIPLNKIKAIVKLPHY